MGGFALDLPDYPRFPVNTHQVHYLVKHSFIEFPRIDRETIRDKNKADAFFRILASIQILWFALECIGRAVQHFSISMLELDVVPIVLCTFPTYYFWFHKPLDVSTTTTLYLEGSRRLGDVLVFAGESAREPFQLTPLDFVNPLPDPYQALDPVMWGFEHILGLGANSRSITISKLGNTLRMNSGKVRITEAVISTVIALTFIGVHPLAWNFTFPTLLKRDLTRAFCLLLLGCYISLSSLWLLMAWQLSNICRLCRNPKVRTVTELCARMPPALQYILLLLHVGSYGLGRLFIIAEGLANLRALPASCFRGVEWANLFPYI
jgi:hypothetical protein